VPWSQRYFKGKKVWVLTDDSGAIAADEKGLVPMRYQNDDNAKVYSAHSKNLSGDADGHGSASPEVVSKAKKSTPPGTNPPAAKISLADMHAAWGPKVVSREVPDTLVALKPPEPGIVEVYTDGACSGNPGPCGYGAVLRRGDDYEEISQYLGQGTNNIGELMAIRVALEHIDDKSRPVRLFTDSTYCIGVLTQGWKAKANQELIAEIRTLMSKFKDLRLIKVKGHSGHPLNDRADHLATRTITDGGA
jgi:ribonuclease HI